MAAGTCIELRNACTGLKVACPPHASSPHLLPLPPPWLERAALLVPLARVACCGPLHPRLAARPPALAPLSQASRYGGRSDSLGLSQGLCHAGCVGARAAAGAIRGASGERVVPELRLEHQGAAGVGGLGPPRRLVARPRRPPALALAQRAYRRGVVRRRPPPHGLQVLPPPPSPLPPSPSSYTLHPKPPGRGPGGPALPRSLALPLPFSPIRAGARDGSGRTAADACGAAHGQRVLGQDAQGLVDLGPCRCRSLHRRSRRLHARVARVALGVRY